MSTQPIDQKQKIVFRRENSLLDSRSYFVFGYALIAFPIGVFAILIGTVGKGEKATRIQSRFITILNPRESHRSSALRRSRPVIHALLAMPFNFLAFIPTWVVTIVMTVRGICYPLVTDRSTLSKSWGGPTLLGAWAAHFAVGLVCLLGVMIFLKILAKAQRRLASRYLTAH